MQPFLKRIVATMVLLVIASATAAQTQYKVRTGDILTIEVLEDRSLDRSVQVLPDGRFTFPFAGALQAAGRNATEIQGAIQAAIQSNFATPPTVFVSIQPRQDPLYPLSASAGISATPDGIDVYFLGELNSPGLVTVKRGTTLLQAVAVSGGVSRFAAVKRIQLRRTDPATGVQRVTILNYKALANGAITNDIELKDGDVILVPERRLFE